MGIVWTLNADAAETSEAEAPAAVVAPAQDPVSRTPSAPPADDPTAVAPIIDTEDEPLVQPPKLLPWGAKPKKIKRARAGASSAAVAAAGAGAAPADKSGSLEPEPGYAPKGNTSPRHTLRTTRTDLVPPMPPPVGAAPAPAPSAEAKRPVYFSYAKSEQYGESDGTWANLTIEKPNLVEGDYHTLAELAVRSADGEQVVEVGWTVDRLLNKDSDPHLFVFYWKDGVRAKCYNACNFTQWSKTVKPGDTLPVDTQKRFGIRHASGVWWIAYDSEYIGYFSDRVWDGRYTKAGLVQWFGEVAAATPVACSEMGNGVPALNELSPTARIGSITLPNGPDVDVKLKAKADPPYTVFPLSDETFGFGGPYYPKDEEGNETSPC